MGIREKKAGAKLTLRYIIVIIGLVFVGAIILLFITRMAFEDFFKEESCLRSVQFRGLGAKIPFGVGKGLFPLNCNTNEIDVSTQNPEELKKEIVDELYNSWYRLGQGQYSFLKQTIWVGPAESTEGACAISSVMFFDETATGKLIEDLDIYLLKEKVPQKDYSYYKFFTHEYEVEEGKTKTYELFIKDSFEIKDYYLLYISINDNEGNFNYPVLRDRIRYWSFELEPETPESFRIATPVKKCDWCKETFSDIPFAIFLEKNVGWQDLGVDLDYSVSGWKGNSYDALLLVPLENDLSKGCFSLQSLP